MTTVAEVLADLLPMARALIDGPMRGTAASVAWVRVLRARVPALDALEPGDLVIVPSGALDVVAPSSEGVESLAVALVAGPASAVVVLVQDGGPGPSVRLLAERLAAAGIPAVAASGAEPAATERAVIAYLVNSRAALERRAEELERRLEAIALAKGDLAALVAAVGTSLGRAVALEGRRGDPLAVHAPETPAAATAAARYLADRSGVALRVRLPAPGDGGDARRGTGRPGPAPVRGSLLLLGDAVPTLGERLACERVAALLSLELGRDVAVHRARESARRNEALPADGPPWVAILARQVASGSEDAEQRDALRAELRLLAPSRRLALRGDVESLEYRLVATAGPDDPLGLATADRVARFLRRTVAVSQLFHDAAGRSAAEADARATLQAAEVYGAAPGVVRADRLHVYRILGDLHNLPDAERLARSLLAPVLAGRGTTVVGRLGTLRALLDAPGPGEAAHVLGVHRNTVAYRVRRIEELGGWDLGDPDLRLALSVALRIVQSAQE